MNKNVLTGVILLIVGLIFGAVYGSNFGLPFQGEGVQTEAYMHDEQQMDLAVESAEVAGPQCPQGSTYVGGGQDALGDFVICKGKNSKGGTIYWVQR
jgi:hypothetical protein